MPLTFIAFGVAALSIIGLPPLGGAWSKWQLGLGAAETGQSILVAILMLSSLLNVAYLVPIAVRGFMPAPARSDRDATSESETGWRLR